MIRKTILFFIAFLVSFNIGCSFHDKKEVSKKINSTIRKEIIKIPMIKGSSNYYAEQYVDKDSYTIFNHFLNRLEIYDWKKRKLKYFIDFEEMGPNKVVDIQHFIINDTKAYIITRTHLAIFNQEKFVRKIPLNYSDALVNLPPSYYSGEYGYAKVENDRILFTSDNNATTSSKSLLSLTISTEKIDSIFNIDLPPQHTEYGPSIKRLPSFDTPFVLDMNNKIILNYKFNNHILVYNIDDNSIKTIEHVKSKYSPNEIPVEKLINIQPSNIEELVQIELKELNFREIIYDPFRNIYIRSHTWYEGEKEKTSLMFFNTNFEILDEILLDSKKMGIFRSDFTITEDGILFIQSEPEKEDIIYLKIMDISFK